MKAIFTNLIFVVIILITFCSCGSVPETINVDNYDKNPDSIKNIVLFSTMIGKIDVVDIGKLPGTGLIGSILDAIDASNINADIESIADSIINSQKQIIDNNREIVARSLRNNFKCNVLYSDSLISNKGYIEIMSKFNQEKSLKTGDKRFPDIIIAANEVNCFKFKKGNVIDYFKDEENYKTTVSNIANHLNTDLIVISYSHLNMIGDCKLRLDTYLYFFDKSGDLLTKAFNHSTPTEIKCSQIKDYKKQLDNISNLLDPLAKKVVSIYKGN